ncbi:MAG: hypothetical protein KC656_34715 [Myxococcales bacterium]|nr:hypothetical protein [Myxococcales bacterium]MCB9694117.1 hypothetical protein [Alphaproteobacteria bacterium]
MWTPTARPPDALLALGDDPTGRLVLADWLEEYGEDAWARWLRQGAPRWRGLVRVLRAHGMRMRRQDAGFLWVDDVPPRAGQASLAWQVRDPAALPALLDTPVWFRATHLHLAAWRARTALPRVLEALAGLRPDLRTLEVTGVAVDPALLLPFPELERLAFRPAFALHAELPVREIHLILREPRDLQAFASLSTPGLESLAISGVGEPLDVPVDEVVRAFDRPFRRVAIERGLRGALAPGILAARPDSLLTRDPPRSWEQDWSRWTVEV